MSNPNPNNWKIGQVEPRTSEPSDNWVEQYCWIVLCDSTAPHEDAIEKRELIIRPSHAKTISIYDLVTTSKWWRKQTLTTLDDASPIVMAKDLTPRTVSLNATISNSAHHGLLSPRSSRMPISVQKWTFCGTSSTPTGLPRRHWLASSMTLRLLSSRLSRSDSDWKVAKSTVYGAGHVSAAAHRQPHWWRPPHCSQLSTVAMLLIMSITSVGVESSLPRCITCDQLQPANCWAVTHSASREGKLPHCITSHPGLLSLPSLRDR